MCLLKSVLYADVTNVVFSDTDRNVLGVKIESGLTNLERRISAIMLTLNIETLNLSNFQQLLALMLLTTDSQITRNFSIYLPASLVPRATPQNHNCRKWTSSPRND